MEDGEEERIKGDTDCRAALRQPQLALGPCCSEGGPHGGHDIAHIPEGPTPGFGSHRNHQEQLNQPEAPPAAQCPWGSHTQGHWAGGSKSKGPLAPQ